MMRVLVVASTFPSRDDDTVPAFVRDQVLALKLADPSLDITVLAPHDPRSDTMDHVSHPAYEEYRFHYAWPHSAERLAGRGIMPTLQVRAYMFPLVFTLFAGEFVAMLRLTRRLRPDVIYAHWFTPQAIVARWVGKLTDTPFVFTTHASDVSIWHKIPWVGRRVVRSHVRHARRITAVSRRSMDKLKAFFSDTEWAELEPRTRIIPMGVSSLHPDASNGDPKRILFIGRLVEKKGITYLLEAFAAARASDPALRLTITGDGPLRAEMERRAGALDLPPGAVTFTGYLTGDAKAAVLGDHGVYVVPSIVTDAGDAEGLPVSLMEGMAAAKICVASVESGADDFIDDGENGYLVPQKDAVALRDALERATSLAAAEQQRVGKAARATAEQFHWPVLARQHIDFLLEDRWDA